MTDYTKLIERLRDDTARHDDESRRLCNQAADAIEALQGEVERMKQDRDEWRDSTIAANQNAASEEKRRREMQEQRDQLQAKLDELQRQEPEPEWVIYQPCGKHTGIGWHNVASVNVRVPKYLCPICKPPSQHGITKGTLT